MTERFNFERKSEETLEKAWLNKLSSEAQAFWSKDRKEGEPEIKFKIFFAGHALVKDFEPAKSDFERCDIYIPEFEGYSEAIIEPLNRISRGDVVLDQNQLESLAKVPPSGHIDGFQLALFQTLYRSNKIVTLIDVPNERKAYEILLKTLYSISQQKTLEGKVDTLRRNLLTYSKTQEERDNHMLAQIPRRLKEILAKNPSLRNKKEINVLMTLGSFHTPLYMMMKSLAPESVERHFENPLVFGSFDEAARLIRFGSTVEDLDYGLLARSVLEWEASQYFQEKSRPVSEEKGSQFTSGLLREYVKLFSIDDIRDLYKKVGNGKSFKGLFLLHLRNKGIEPFQV